MKHLFVTSLKLISIFVLALIATGCSSEPKAFPVGTYAVTFTEADNIRIGTDLMTGTSSITFTDTGDFTLSAPKVVINGQYTVIGDQVKFEESNPSFPCASEPSYIYQWKLEDDQLTFSAIEDNCFLRTLAMTIHPYEKEE